MEQLTDGTMPSYVKLRTKSSLALGSPEVISLFPSPPGLLKWLEFAKGFLRHLAWLGPFWKIRLTCVPQELGPVLPQTIGHQFLVRESPRAGIGRVQMSWYPPVGD